MRTTTAPACGPCATAFTLRRGDEKRLALAESIKHRACVGTPLTPPAPQCSLCGESVPAPHRVILFDADPEVPTLHGYTETALVADVGDGHESLETLAAIQASHRYEAENARTKAMVAELWAEVPAHDPEETTTARALAADEWSGFMSEMFDSSEEL